MRRRCYIIRAFLTLIILVVASQVFAQKHDYVWVAGYDSYTGYYKGFRFGNTIMNFNYDPLQVEYDSLGMNIDKDNTSFSDSDGNLLFYTNAIYIANSLDEAIANSDSLNAGWFQYDWDSTIQHDGYRSPQGIISVPTINNPNQYYLLHTWDDSFGDQLACKRVLLTLLDMSANSGHGNVLYKNQPVINDLLGDEVTMTRHGNGRDWWALVQKRNSNCYYRILVSDKGVQLLDDKTCGGSSPPQGDIGATCFSPDGSKYVYLSGYTGLNIFDFDRCSGELSNPINLPLPAIVQNTWIGLGVAISPNNRFLYVSVTEQLYQFDLQASDIIGSIDTVGIYDDSAFLAKFAIEQLGPDGKIYISCGNADTLFHVINNPDLKGDSCNFVQRGRPLASFCWAVPNLPNYRLGREVGSACDTLWSNIDEVTIRNREKILKVFPNPATDVVTVDYGFTDWSISGVVSLEIVNELGQVVYQQGLPQYSGYQKLDVSKYATGLYTAFIQRNEQVIAVQKFAKQ